jgi:hypothetical protein
MSYLKSSLVVYRRIMSYLKSPLVVYWGIISYLKSPLVVYRGIMSYLKSPLVVYRRDHVLFEVTSKCLLIYVICVYLRIVVCNT